MEDTQTINWDAEEEEETEQSRGSLGHSSEPVGQLRIFSGTHGPEKDFPLYLGKNMVGRSPECAVTLPFPSISKQHAVIEILAWNKAPILQDCGSLNGTQILRPPKALSPGVSHRLRDKELILFADFPCQYHRLDVPQPIVSQGPLTVEETPRVQGGTQPSRLLVEDSEEEVDFVSERCVTKESATTSSPLPTVVPESDEEGPSPAPGGSGTSFPFNLDSDTDEEKDQQPATGETALTSRKDTTAEAEQPEASGVLTTVRLVKAQSSVENDQGTKIKNVGNGEILEKSQPPEDSDTDVDEEDRSPGRAADVHLERAQTTGFVDSDTDMEEEGIPATPVVPMKKRQIFHGVGTKDPGTPGVAHVQESPTGSDTDVEEGKVPLVVPAERNQASVVINSDTDDEEEVSAALTLACLKENGSVLWDRGTGMGEQPVVLQEQSHIDSGKDSDTDMEEEWLPVGKKETVPSGHTDKGGALVIADSEKDQLSFRDSDVGEKTDLSSSRIHPQRSQNSSSTIMGNNTEMEEEVPSGPVVTNQEPSEGTNQIDVEAGGSLAKMPVVPLEEDGLPDENWDTNVIEDRSLVVADVKKNQHLEKENPRPADVFEQEQGLEIVTQSGSPMTQVEQILLHPVKPTQSQREGAQTPTGRGEKAHKGRTKHSKDNYDDPEDLDLQATQCFVERENQSVEVVQRMEDEPTQAFTCTLPQEPSPSQTPGAPDEPWEVLATQPFCLREVEVSEPQPTAAHFEVHRSCQSPSRAVSRDQHPENPVHTEPLERAIEGKGMQTVEKEMDTPKGTAERVQPEKWLSEREIKGWPSNSEKEDVTGEKELTREIEDKEQNQMLAGAVQTQEFDTKVKSVSPKRDRESLALEMETSKEIQENEKKEALTREVLERQEDKPVPKKKCKPAELEVNLDRGEADTGSQNQKGQATSPTPEFRVEAGHLQGLTSGPIVSESQPGGRRRALVNPRRQQRGHSKRKMPAAKKASRGEPEPPDACLPLSEVSAPPHSPGYLAPQPFLPPSPSSSEAPTLSKRHSGSQEAPETPLSSESFHPKHIVRPRWSSRTTPSPLSTAPTTPIDQPIPPEPTYQATRTRTRRTSVKTPEPVVPRASELQSSTSTEPVSHATRGRALRSSAKTPGPVIPSGLELQSCTSTVQLVTPEPTSHATRGKTRRSSIQTSRPVVPTGPELQPSTSTVQPVTPKTTSHTTRGKTRRSSVQTPGPVAPTGPELQPSTSTVQLVTPKTASEATQDRTHGSFDETPETVASIGSKLLPSPSTEQHPVPSGPTSRATRGRKNRSSIKTPESVIPTDPDLQPSTSVVQTVTPKPTSRTTRSRACKSSILTSDPEPFASIDQPVIPETITHSRTLNFSSVSATPVVATSEVPPATIAQPVPLEPMPQANCNRKQDAEKHGSFTPVNLKPCPAPPESKPKSSNNQRPGAARAIESFGTIPEPASHQLPQAPTHAPRNQKIKKESTSGFTPEPLPKFSQIRKRPSATEGSPPLQKRPQKTVFLKEEEDTVEEPGKEEDTVIPGPGKRKRDQAEEGPKGIPSRSLRRAKPSQGSAPKVLFTGVVDARGERAVLALGGTLANSVTDASHLVTDRIRRTVKFLCALGRGIPILSLDWLYQSRKAGHFLPPDEYLVTDPEQEKNFGFSLRDALSRARERRLLEGYEIHVTPGVQPPPPQMGEIISCCGGTILSNMPRLYKPQRVVITCPEDFPRCSIPCRVGLPLLSSEFLLTGVLKQEAKPEDFVFSNAEMSFT
ncbi:mediator of DNA damage checkpoint protein 1 isoform X1 [Dipodomys spectabilis]|uniref:mediator of DNA damage checkpoint protein 1 isoform X1 n=1 Tax=Dipodomys spectabilis TaxID=105255 RepID=UPI001C536B56|nr:mediator of DNA damage checkpoint protein 1 isoform X1 [Dipodomys spectabilis]XP_042539957.1 mediator of DNA damage checkpoint protein 1 isoform X1 [Dipodomys spectabilis]XP_042539958.1 mediator of DNA damage checkpoint protein 1 isoform X1 [Dipodomys spectabilis]